MTLAFIKKTNFIHVHMLVVYLFNSRIFKSMKRIISLLSTEILASVLHGVKLLCDNVSSLILSEGQVSCNFAFR